MKLFSLLAAALTLCLGMALPFAADAVLPNHCAKFDSNPKVKELIRQLTVKLKYSEAEFCGSTRIMDIDNETRMVYHREDDRYHPYEFITLHYNEYSCEYQYSWDQSLWRDQGCYNTW